MPERRDIFISYSRANTGFARDLYAKLQALGFTLWRDRRDMEGGDTAARLPDGQHIAAGDAAGRVLFLKWLE
jgi:hypothetical protein